MIVDTARQPKMNLGPNVLTSTNSNEKVFPVDTPSTTSSATSVTTTCSTAHADLEDPFEELLQQQQQQQQQQQESTRRGLMKRRNSMKALGNAITTPMRRAKKKISQTFKPKLDRIDSDTGLIEVVAGAGAADHKTDEKSQGDAHLGIAAVTQDDDKQRSIVSVDDATHNSSNESEIRTLQREPFKQSSSGSVKLPSPHNKHRHSTSDRPSSGIHHQGIKLRRTKSTSDSPCPSTPRGINNISSNSYRDSKSSHDVHPNRPDGGGGGKSESLRQQRSSNKATTETSKNKIADRERGIPPPQRGLVRTLSVSSRKEYHCERRRIGLSINAADAASLEAGASSNEGIHATTKTRRHRSSDNRESGNKQRSTCRSSRRGRSSAEDVASKISSSQKRRSTGKRQNRDRSVSVTPPSHNTTKQSICLEDGGGNGDSNGNDRRRGRSTSVTPKQSFSIVSGDHHNLSTQRPKGSVRRSSKRPTSCCRRRPTTERLSNSTSIGTNTNQDTATCCNDSSRLESSNVSSTSFDANVLSEKMMQIPVSSSSNGLECSQAGSDPRTTACTNSNGNGNNNNNNATVSLPPLAFSSSSSSSSSASSAACWKCCCGETVEGHHSYCDACGHSVKWECQLCHCTKNAAKFRFCIGCGTSKDKCL